MNEADKVTRRAQLVSDGLCFRKAVDGPFLEAASDGVHDVKRLALAFGG